MCQITDDSLKKKELLMSSKYERMKIFCLRRQGEKGKLHMMTIFKCINTTTERKTSTHVKGRASNTDLKLQ